MEREGGRSVVRGGRRIVRGRVVRRVWRGLGEKVLGKGDIERRHAELLTYPDSLDSI